MSSMVDAKAKNTRVARLLRNPWSYLPPVLLVLLALAPLGAGQHTLGIWTVALIFAGVSTGWAIAGGLAGLTPLGHAAFFGLGAYGSALAIARFDVSPWLGILVGVAASSALAWLMTVLAVRFNVRGTYFALYTLAWAEMLRISATNLDAVGRSNGVLIPYLRDGGFWEMQFSDSRAFYLVAVVYAALAILVFAQVRRSRLGWRLSAIRGNEETAAASGVNISRSLSSAMAVSAAVAAVGGGLYAQYIQFIDPELAFNVGVSIDIAVRAILGGAMFLLGPLLGSSAMALLMEGTQRYITGLPSFSMLLVGLAIIGLAHWFPQGIGGVLAQLKSVVVGRRRQRSEKT